MADHGDNYTRLKGEDGEEIGLLSAMCGHHCGVIMAGTTQIKEHCPCPECHNTVDL